MKKLTLLFLLLLGFTMQAQEIAKNALGLRLGGADGIGFEISYQRALGSNNRLEADLGWRDNDHFEGFQLTGLYQWVWQIEQRFNWYAGVGGGFGDREHDHHHNGNHDHDDDEGVYVFVAGVVGIEYSFDIPLMLSLDFRPGIGSKHYDGYDLALGIRYQF